MTDKDIQRIIQAGGYLSLVVSLGFLTYTTFSLITGEVVVASRTSSEAVITRQVSKWPFFLGVSLYAMGALIFSWIAWTLLRPDRK